MQLFIDAGSAVPAWRQVYRQLADKILSGELPGGARLPATRALASELSCSRNVILEAYAQLTAEGFLETRAGSGTYVVPGILMKEKPAARQASAAEPDVGDAGVIDFRSGVPALDMLPLNAWGLSYRRICMETELSSFSYQQPDACRALREAIARRLASVRGVRCTPGDIVVTNGAVHAISMLEELLLGKGRHVVLEDPVTVDIPRILSKGGAKIHAVPVDEHGLCTGRLPEDIDCSVIYTIPSHQFPLGAVLPAKRRVELLAYAARHNAWIVEDDYDSEYRYQGAPLRPLQQLDPGRVIYLGTFSKTLFPALRIGYAVLPGELVEPFRELVRLNLIHLPILEQLALARFMEEGQLDRHIRRMERVYRRRRECLVSGLKSHFGDRVEVLGEAAGLHIVAAFYGIAFTGELINEINKSGVRVYPVEEHCIEKGMHAGKIIMGYGNLSEDMIDEGLSRLKGIL